MALDIPTRTNQNSTKKPKKTLPFTCGRKMGTFPWAKKIVNNSCYIFQPICWSPPLGKYHRHPLKQGIKKTKII
jgi:hypothetical protein